MEERNSSQGVRCHRDTPPKRFARGRSPGCPENIERAASLFLPEFVPEGRIRVGRTVLFPNIIPWVPDSAVAVFSPVHFARPADFVEEDLVNGLRACRDYFERLSHHKPQVEHHFVGWNYLPTACSSQLHPHIQAFASETPLRQHRELMQASRAYYATNQHNYWLDFTVEEKTRSQRYVGASGGTVWFTSFAGRSWLLDLLALFPYRASILELSDEDLRGFCHGLAGVFKYMADRNYFSFNLALYSGLPGEDYFWTHARLVQRSVYGPLDQSDTGVFQTLQSSYIMLRRPEDICRELRSYAPFAPAATDAHQSGS